MRRKLQWRVVVILAVIGLSIWAFYPPGDKLRLGLDLRGGVHLDLRVQTDDALRVETELAIERLREALRAEKVAVASIDPMSAAEFSVTGVQDPQAYGRAERTIDALFERVSSAGGRTYRMRPEVARQLRHEAVVQAVHTIERRVNELGVSEPVVARLGGDRILVQLPGVDDVARAKAVIRSTAFLEKKLVEQGPFASEAEARRAYGERVPADLQVLADEEGIYYVVRRAPVITGRELRSARQELDRVNRPAVGFTLSAEGARAFGAFTAAHVGRRLAIVLDGRIISAPRIDGPIADRGQIEGRFTTRSAHELALQLRAGALPASLDYLQERTIGPSLGRASVVAGVTASLVGLTLVMAFLVAYYRLAGLNAIAALGANLLILLGLMAYLGATLTLPGIAGLILIIGIGVDTNVLIFERIREELPAAAGVRAAVRAGFDRVWWTIVDTHASSLIAAAFLFQFGTGPIRGFATTLTIGLAAHVFTAVFVSRTIFEIVLTRRAAQERRLSI